MKEKVSVLSLYIAGRIKKRMEVLEISIADLAHGMGVNTSIAQQMIEGVMEYDIIMILRLSKVIDLELESLLPSLTWLEENENKEIKKIITYQIVD